MEFSKVIAYIGTFILILTTLIYAFHFNKLNKRLKVFFVFIFLLTVSESIGTYLFYYKQNNIFMWHIFNYVELIVLSIFYAQFYPLAKRKFIYLLALFTSMFLLIGSFFFYDLYEYNVLGFFALKIFVISMSIREIYQYYFGAVKHYFYINLGFIITSIINLSIFTFGNILMEMRAEKENFKILWIVNTSVFIVSLFLYMYELYKFRRWTVQQ